MANPVGQHQIPPLRAPENPQINREVPMGAGAAPTVLQPDGTPAADKGYVETFLSWIWNWGSWLFQKVFFCFAKDPDPAPEPPQPPVAPPPPPIARPPAPVLVEGVRVQIDFLNRFRELPEREQNFISFQIGMKKSGFWNRIWHRSSYEDLGRHEIQKDPLILRDYLVSN